jgi:hypothetical protein
LLLLLVMPSLHLWADMARVLANQNQLWPCLVIIQAVRIRNGGGSLLLLRVT